MRVQEVYYKWREIYIVPSKHFDYRLKQRGIYNDNVMDAVRKYISNIYENTKSADVVVLYDAELRYSFGIQVFENDIIITTTVDDKMAAGREQKIFRIEREDNLFEVIPFKEYIKNWIRNIIIKPLNN